MPHPETLIGTLEIAPKVSNALSTTKTIYKPLSAIARTARLVDGEWISEAINKVPGVNHAWNFFGKVVEKPVAIATHAALSYSLKHEVNKQLQKAKASLTGSSWLRRAASSAWGCVVPNVPAWIPGVTNVVAPMADVLTDMGLEQLTNKMVNALDPLVNAPAAEYVAKGVSYVAVESTKWYVGHKIQYMVISFLAEQFKESQNSTAGAALGYAKQADDYRILAAIFTTMLAANLLPYVWDKLTFTSQKEQIKAQLSRYVLSKSEIDPKSLSGQIYAIALDATLEHLIATNRIDVNQIRIALASIQTMESARGLVLG